MTARAQTIQHIVNSGLTTSEATQVAFHLESAGLAVVDAELHKALVEAVRARQWEACSIEYWPEPTDDYELANQEERGEVESDISGRALDRAVALLAERGDG